MSMFKIASPPMSSDVRKRIMEQLAKQAEESLDAVRKRTMSQFINQSGGAVADQKVFEVFRAANGFYANVGSACVVGMTLSDVCSAACARATEDAVTAEIQPTQANDPMGNQSWSKALVARQHGKEIVWMSDADIQTLLR